MVTTEVPVADAVAAPRRPVLVTGGWLLIAVAWVAALLLTGSAAADLLRWLLAVGAGVLLPGFAMVRAVRRAPAALIEDLGWAIPAGLLVAMLGWLAGGLSGITPPPWLFGPAVAALLVALPGTRGRVLARPASGWGTGANLATAGALLVAVGWMTVDYLRLNPADPGAAGHTYYPDGIYQLAVAGQLRGSLGLHYPLVAGEPYSYHWFGHAVLAHLLGGGTDPFDAVLRLAPATLLPATLLLAAVVAAGVARRVSAGPFAAILLGVLGSTTGTLSPDGQSLAMIQTYWWASITTVFGWLAVLGVSGCAVALLRGGPAGPAPVALFLPLLAFAAGAKSTNLPVLLGGAGLALLFLLCTRARSRGGWLVLGSVAGMLALATVTVYAVGGSGLRPEVFGTLRRNAARLFPGLTGPRPPGPELALPPVATTAVLATVLLFFLPLLPRLAGFAFADRRDVATWFLAGVPLAGALGMVLLRHPGESEGFLLISAYPVGVLGSAAGLARAAGRVRDLPWPRLAAAGAGLGLALSLLCAWYWPASPLPGWLTAFGHAPAAGELSPAHQAARYLAPLGTLVLLLLAAGALGLLVTRRRPRHALAVAAVGTLLGTGLLSTGIYLTAATRTYSQDAVAAADNLRIDRDQLAAGDWLAANSAPGDVLGSNRVCTQPQPTAEPPDPCQAKAFTMAALSGRTVEVGGWAYASRNLDSAWAAGQHWTDQPFWDPARLRREQDAFAAPTPDLLDGLYRTGVRWLVAESAGTPADTAALDRLAVRRQTLPTVTVWQLRPPISPQ